MGTTTYIDNGVAPVPYENNAHERTIAFYGDEQFTTLNDRLLFDVGLRAERSSANGDANEFFYYPKYSASYRVPLPGKFTDATGTEFKLRAAYGMTGNQPLFGEKYTLLNTPCITGACGTAVDGGTGTAIFGNPDIRPETTRETEVGTDIIDLERTRGPRVHLLSPHYQRPATSSHASARRPATLRSLPTAATS